MSDRQVAVALKYVRGEETAPRVIAKGRGEIAQKIIDLARQYGIPVHKDTDLADVLLKLDLGQLIPPDLYKAVAEVLAFLHRMNKLKA